MPRSFQWRLTWAFVGITALTIALIAPVIINRLDDYYQTQEEQSLRARGVATAQMLSLITTLAAGNDPVVVDTASGLDLNPNVRRYLPALLTELATNVAQADVVVTFGTVRAGVDGSNEVVPAANLTFTGRISKAVAPELGMARDPSIGIAPVPYPSLAGGWGFTLGLANPFTTRAATLGTVAGLLLVLAFIAVVFAVLVGALFARLVTTPLRRLTEASRRLAEGDLTSRIPPDKVTSGTTEMSELARQFNNMADRLEESVATIRRDRDRSRDFLADVSHELRTPIAAMRTFNELLQGDAGADPAARSEFLESSAAQLERLDWLSQNLLELSKLDSGLVLLDLRPEDVRATVQSAVEQAEPAARKRRIHLDLSMPDEPIRIRHDPPRVGQIVSNLIGNALKFTERNGAVRVALSPTPDGGARIEVADTGVGIDADELPKIFDRFYRGSRANEARSTGSGLGLAIVKSIVDMHHGAVAVESRVGEGSRFIITLPADPRAVEGAGDLDGRTMVGAGTASAADASGAVPAGDGNVADSSPVDVSRLNRDAAR